MAFFWEKSVKLTVKIWDFWDPLSKCWRRPCPGTSVSNVISVILGRFINLTTGALVIPPGIISREAIYNNAAYCVQIILKIQRDNLHSRKWTCAIRVDRYGNLRALNQSSSNQIRGNACRHCTVWVFIASVVVHEDTIAVCRMVADCTMTATHFLVTSSAC
jgi:hypothetical protein